ncbi:MAG: hypothetical protein M1816_002841 [Peltula sp. TS41687]|nr:MAG: hypothetical protein M1816_002841 [Peltula sp. TS41687]
MQAPSDNTYQQKRKRRNSNEPIRKSRRLQERKITTAEHSNAKKPEQLPSPSTSRTPPKTSRDGRKRKAALFLEDNPDLSQVFCEPRQKRVQSAASPSLDIREQLQFKEAVPRTGAPIIESPTEPAKELEAREIEQKERHNPISYWAVYHTWPKDFAEHNLMDSSNSTNKRQRTSDLSQIGKEGGFRSYSQSRKNGEVPEQYTAAYQAHILRKGLDMDREKGEDFASEESKKICAELLQIDISTIGPTAVPQDKIRSMIYNCQNRNEGLVNRDVTPLMIPSLRLLYYCGANNLEHVVDEVNAIWYQQCVLEGPRPQPDLAIGLFSSAFTEEEIEKLKRYTSVDNWTQVTTQMFFPFLMCEVKCGRESLDMADRQNMHSCSVAVRAILKIEQEADKYRPGKKMDSLNGQVLVFSISHDQQDARLHGHYVKMQGEKWSYYRYHIRKFDLNVYNDLLAIYNFVQNILKSYLPRHVRRLKDALAALPDPNKPPESSGLPSSSGRSFAASEISLNDDDNSQQDSQSRDTDGFVVPPRPAGSQKSRAKKKGQGSQLLQQNELAQLRQLLEEQGKEAKQRESRLEQLLEEQRREAKQEREKMEREARQEREKMEQEREREREKAEEKMEQLMNLLGIATRRGEAAM